MKRQFGRESRENVLRIRLTKEERSSMDQRAAHFGLETATWARCALLSVTSGRAQIPTTEAELRTLLREHPPVDEQKLFDELKPLLAQGALGFWLKYLEGYGWVREFIGKWILGLR